MLIIRNAPLNEGIINLKRGSFFIDGEVVFLQKVKRMISVVTNKGSLYNIHLKDDNTYSVFQIKRIKNKISNPGGIRFFLRNCAFFI